ncbi:MAG: RNA-binding domain-containing protein [Nitrososphaeria archaeon]
MKIILSAVIHSSEDPEKVKQAILNIIDQNDYESIDLQNDRIIIRAGAATVDKIVKSVKDKNIVPLFLKLLNAGKGKAECKLMFNRQAAHAGQIVICDDPQESPLGPIYLVLNDEAVDYILSKVKIN